MHLFSNKYHPQLNAAIFDQTFEKAPRQNKLHTLKIECSAYLTKLGIRPKIITRQVWYIFHYQT